MITQLTAQDLIQFEEEVAEMFKAKKIRTFIHLYSGGEEHMLEVFESIRKQDWVMCTWRSHYQCLLKGVPRDELKEEIAAGRSIALCFPKYKIISSGIVGGIAPIAVGVAKSIALRGDDEVVHCWLGDMTAETGIVHESIKYAENFKLPIIFHIEDNGKSICTDTRETWGMKTLTYEQGDHPQVDYSKYVMEKYPHAGAGVRVEF